MRHRSHFDLTQRRCRINGSLGTLRGRLVAQFVRRENIEHYKALLELATDETEQQQISKLLAEEEQKQKEAGDRVEG
jgi:hypothetical protein